jgi:predicted ATPase
LPVSYYLHFLADACLKTGRVAEGLEAVMEAHGLTEDLLDIFYEPELRRLEGELLLLTDRDPAEAECCFQAALDLARGNHCKAFELRTAMSLCRLQLAEGRCEHGVTLLESVYEQYDEGLDTVDLQEARGLIQQCQFTMR